MKASYWALTATFILTCSSAIVNCTSEEPACQKWTPESQTNKPSLFIYWATGRLASQMTCYSILLCLKVKHDLKVVIDKETYNLLTSYFQLPNRNKIVILEDTYCKEDIEEMKKHVIHYMEHHSNIDGQLETNLVKMRHGHVVHVFPADPGKRSSYWVAEELVNDHRDLLRQEFSLKAEYGEYADYKLTQLAKTQATHANKPLFVGLHARRTDYVEYSKTKLKNKVVGRSYFNNAMDYFREEFPDNQIFFLGVSDDMGWVSRNLRGSRGLVLAGSKAGSDERRVGEDLALLAACNHTIHSSGMFGLWAGFLAGGELHTIFGIVANS